MTCDCCGKEEGGTFELSRDNKVIKRGCAKCGTAE